MDTPLATNVMMPIDHSQLYRRVATVLNAFTHRSFATPAQIGNVWMVPKDNAAAVNELWDEYLASFPPEQRQHFNCSHCKSWFAKYATIQAVSFNGKDLTRSAVCWEEIENDGLVLSEHELALMRKMRQLVLRQTPARLVFNRKRLELDRAPGRENFEHFYCSARTPKLPSFEDLKTNDQYLANKKTLAQFLNVELQADTINQAHRLFNLDPKYAGYSTHAHRIQMVKTAKDNLAALSGTDRGIYLSLLALTELTTVRSGLVGAFLLKLQESGMDAAKGLFAEMADPKQYRQPSALPHSEQVRLAEAVIADLGLQDSLLFDVARADDPAMPLIAHYATDVEKAENGGVFANVKTVDQKSKVDDDVMNLGELSFAVAWTNYLQNAKSIELGINAATAATYGVVGVMQNREATPILAYDTPEARCPIAALVFNQVLPGTALSLSNRIKVHGIVVDPSKPNPQDPTTTWFFLTTIDTQAPATVGNLLPTKVREELHDYWRVLHHYNQSRHQYIPEGSAILLPIPRVVGQNWLSTTPIQRFHVTLQDGSKVTFRVVTA